MRRARAFWLALIMTLAAVPIVTAPPAHACSCFPPSFADAVQYTDLIALATFRERLTPLPGEVTYDVVLDKIWRGEERRQIKFTTADEITACGLGRIESGFSAVIWATGEKGEYTMSWCDIPMGASGADVEQRLTWVLGEPTDLTREPVGMKRSLVLMGVGVPLGVLLIGAAIWLIRDRRRQQTGR